MILSDLIKDMRANMHESPDSALRYAFDEYKGKLARNSEFAFFAQWQQQDMMLISPEAKTRAENTLKQFVQQSMPAGSSLEKIMQALIRAHIFTSSFSDILFLPYVDFIEKAQGNIYPLKISERTETKIVYFNARTARIDQLKGNSPIPAQIIAKETKRLIVILFTQGHEGANHVFGLLKFYLQRGISVCCFSHNKPNGSKEVEIPIEQEYYEEAQAVINYTKTSRDLADEEIILHGFSFGAAIAANVALQYPTAHLILEQAFTSTSDLIQKKISTYYKKEDPLWSNHTWLSYIRMSYMWGLQLLYSERAFITHMIESVLPFSTVDKVSAVATKILIVGIKDEPNFSDYFAEKIKERCPKGKAKLILKTSDWDSGPAWHTVEKHAKEFEEYLVGTGLCQYKTDAE